jgi:predicted enzyme related to lactoylglutathione lyase
MPASRFVWYELMTSDVRAAAAFYAEAVGWKADHSDPQYTLLKVGDAQVAGMMATPPELKAMGVPPTWSGYVLVDDVDATEARVLQLGGKVHRPGSDIPDVGRFAVVADPQGASFMLFKPFRTDPPPMPAPGAPGTTGWHELHAADGATVWKFYATLFGWTKGEAMDMGPDGIYQMFDIDGVPSGAVMTKEAAQAAPGWRYYFQVDAIDAAVRRLSAAGGVVTMGPHPVPGDLWIVHARDPQGAVFALMSMTK